MLKRRIIALVTGIVLLMAVMGISGVVADSLGLDITPQTYACSQGSGGGGGC